MTSEILMVRALERGLLLSDFDMFTIGGLYDYIYTYDNLHMADEEYEGGSERMATQADFDNF